MSFRVPEQFRVVSGRLGSTSDIGNNGAFLFPACAKPRRFSFFVIASDGMGWEHVSVSIPGVERCPTWEEMCWVKNQFWSEEDCVVQFHPPKSQHVNNHAYCLHLWRPICGQVLPVPPSIMVGDASRNLPA